MDVIVLVAPRIEMGRQVIVATVAALLASGAFSLLSYVQAWRKRCENLRRKVADVEATLQLTLQKCSAERKGRIRAQQELRRMLTANDATDLGFTTYPMAPIGIIRSCFSTRNGTPRQPLLVPLARAILALSPNGVPPSALDGLAEYSHCWILYVFHANTDLPHLWTHKSHQGFKAKVRVPRLDGGKLGVFATRSPHRPCPIGLSLAKVEAVQGRMLFLSGIDLVDGTPVLDVKPYLPFCDAVLNAQTPSWVSADSPCDPLHLTCVEFASDFSCLLSNCWKAMGKDSLYSGPDELQSLVEQVLTRDIRSVKQRLNPRASPLLFDRDSVNSVGVDSHMEPEEEIMKLGTVVDGSNESEMVEGCPVKVMYHLIVEGIVLEYTVDSGRVFVLGAKILSGGQTPSPHLECNYNSWNKALAGARRDDNE